MSVKKYKFVSPGIFIKEVDQSFRPAARPRVGPVIIGRTRMGPAMRPVRVDSFGDFVNTFGNTVSGFQGGDIWRDGNLGGPTYAAYAAQAYLAAKVGPVTMMRLLGTEHANRESGGKAGWTTSAGHNVSEGSNGGAYGLFLFNSASAAGIGASTGAVQGCLAAVWYLNQGSITLRGTDRTGVTTSGSAALFRTANASTHELRAEIRDSSGNAVLDTSFNFSRTSDLYIRKVFNTNPHKTNTACTPSAQAEKYWLGQTYDQQIEHLITGSANNHNLACIIGLKKGSYGFHNKQMPYQNGKTGWFVAQDTGTAGSYNVTNAQKLFRLVGLEGGTSVQERFKVSIEDVKPAVSPTVNAYGTFSVVLRSLTDTDNNVLVVERFTKCDLNPNSNNYVAKKIGDKWLTWSDSENRYREYGDYDNRSKYVRVEVNESVNNAATEPDLLPFGVIGPQRPISYRIIAGHDNDGGGGHQTSVSPRIISGETTGSTAQSNAYYLGGSGIPRAVSGSSAGIVTYGPFTGSVYFPALAQRSSSLDGGLGDQTNAYFGVTTNRSGSIVYCESVPDFLRPIDEGLGRDTWDADNSSTVPSWTFSLDELKYDTTKKCANYVSGSRAAGTSVTAVSSSFQTILNLGFDRFTTVFHGGFDGVDIKEMEPFGFHVASNSTDEFKNYAYHSIKRAITGISDPEFVEMNLLAAPGVKATGLQNHMMTTCEDRGDALAVLDLEGDYTPRTESTDSVANRRGTVASVVSNLKGRNIDSSYGCAYYPWVQIKDSVDGDILWAPPSVVALGVMGSSERASEVWFAPAGFNRGGLSEGAAGIPVVGVRQRLTKADRDKLYEQAINPIAKFPSEGIVVFGQKTLQARASALDRINVRRLMIHLKKEVSRLATQVLFDQNVEATWNRFKALVEPLLASTKARFGLTEYRLILDETTTTPDLIDQNILYAKILLKPARAIEFIAIDFNIMPTGASFDD